MLVCRSVLRALRAEPTLSRCVCFCMFTCERLCLLCVRVCVCMCVCMRRCVLRCVCLFARVRVRARFRAPLPSQELAGGRLRFVCARSCARARTCARPYVLPFPRRSWPAGAFVLLLVVTFGQLWHSRSPLERFSSRGAGPFWHNHLPLERYCSRGEAYATSSMG